MTDALIYILALVPIVAGALVIALVIAAPHGWQDDQGFHLGHHPDDREP
jgi:hypothetical protein